jgi:hypothetical protein
VALPLLKGGFPSLFTPNAFSPNGDGINDFLDFFQIGLKGGAPYAYNATVGLFQVFDRWGSLIFQTGLPQSCPPGNTNGSFPHWNGYTNVSTNYNWWQQFWGKHQIHAGDKVQSAVYIWQLLLGNCDHGLQLVSKGNVTVQ